MAIGDIEPLQEYLDLLDEDYWEMSDHPLFKRAAFILEEMRSKLWCLRASVCRMIDENGGPKGYSSHGVILAVDYRIGSPRGYGPYLCSI
ncbi:hypothetical protein [uncultured Desulfosarcina sp.]|uniref:hypothetical protein n=1 Tax=uncultured Desulfosarcina sp. TaxID=218289 RepID=UPI0029C8F850|nr:hypothetical protein [uncultured Desulfosarcina sp.]